MALTTTYNLKIENLKKIYDYIKENPGAKKSQIASKLGLSFSSVSNLSTLLEEKGLITCLNNVQYTGGRKASDLISNVNYAYCMVVDLHKTDRCIIGVLNLAGEIISKKFFSIDERDSIELIIEKIRDKYLLFPSKITNFIKGVVICVSAVCDKNDHLLKISSNPLLNNVDLIAIFKQYINKDIILLENDANLASLSQINSKGNSNLLFVLITQGVGLGIIIDGKVYEGDNGYAGELGHFKVRNSDKICKCGHKGCLRNVATLRSIAEDLNESEIFNECKEKTDYAMTLKTRYLRNDNEVRTRIDLLVSSLSETFAQLFDIFNPRLLCVGGDLWPVFDIIKPKLVQQTRDLAKISTVSDIKIDFIKDSSSDLVLRGGLNLFFEIWLKDKFPLLFN